MSSDGFNDTRTRLIVETSAARPSSAKYLAVEGNQHRVGGDERVEREQAERGRAVDEDPVEVRAQGLEQTPQPALAVGEADELDFGAGEAPVSGHDLQVVDGARDDEAGRIEGRVAFERAVDRAARRLLAAQPDAAGHVALRIEVDEQHLLVGKCE